MANPDPLGCMLALDLHHKKQKRFDGSAYHSIKDCWMLSQYFAQVSCKSSIYLVCGIFVDFWLENHSHHVHERPINMDFFVDVELGCISLASQHFSYSNLPSCAGC